MDYLSPYTQYDECVFIIGGGVRGLGKGIVDFNIGNKQIISFCRRPEMLNKDALGVRFDLESNGAIENVMNQIKKCCVEHLFKKVQIHVITGGGLGYKPLLTCQSSIERIYKHNVIVPSYTMNYTLKLAEEIRRTEVHLFLYSSAASQKHIGLPEYCASKLALEAHFKTAIKCIGENMAMYMLRLGHVDIEYKYFHQQKKEKPVEFNNYIKKAVPTSHFTSIKEIIEFTEYASSQKGMFNGIVADVSGGYSWN